MNDTQRYAVYHANDMLEVNLPPAMRWYADQSGYYTHVADVVAPLEQIFTLTNHIDHPWTDNPEVVWLATSRIRSTSVGDIVVSCDSGQAWLIMPVGLQELPPLQGMHPGHEQIASSPSMKQHELHAPFGLSQVANYEEVSRRYVDVISDLAQEAPLPQVLPARHPLLAQLEGRYALQDHLPPWWHGCVEALTTARHTQWPKWLTFSGQCASPAQPLPRRCMLSVSILLLSCPLLEENHSSHVANPLR